MYLQFNMKTIKGKQKGFMTLIAILIIMALTIFFMVNVLDAQYSSSNKSPEELDSESANITNAVEKTKNLKNSIEATNRLLNLESEGL